MQIPLFPRKFSLSFIGLLTYAVFSLSSMALMGIAAAFLIVCLLLDRSHSSLWQEICEVSRQVTLRNYLKVSIILIVACVLSLISAYAFPLTFGGKTVQLHGIKDLGKSWYFIFPILQVIAWRRLDSPQRAQILKAWLYTFGILSILGCIQFFTGWPRSQPNPLLPGFFHSTLFLGHHLSVANILIFPFFAGLDLFFQPNLAQQAHISRPILLSFLIFGLLTLFATYSRTLWVSLPIGWVAWAFLRLPRKSAIVSLLLIGVGVGIVSQSPWVQERLRRQEGTWERFTIWQVNQVFFESRPLLGIGFGKNQELSAYYLQSRYPHSSVFVGHAHNLYLELLAGVGLIGTFTWFLWMGFQIRKLLALQNLRSSPTLSAGFLSAWVTFLINGLTQVNFWEGKVLHQIMWITSLTLFWSLEYESRRPFRHPFLQSNRNDPKILADGQ